MPHKKDSFEALREELDRRYKVVAAMGEETFRTLSEEEQNKQYQLRYLAEILVGIFLDLNCQESGHSIKRCAACQKDTPFFRRF